MISEMSEGFGIWIHKPLMFSPAVRNISGVLQGKSAQQNGLNQIGIKAFPCFCMGIS